MTAQESRRLIAHAKREQKRHARLQQAYWRYVEAAKKLGFHALTRDELDDRSRELARMLNGANS